MMISRADFEELIPEIFARKPPRAALARPKAKGKTHLARWGDSAGLKLAASVKRKAAEAALSQSGE